MAAEISLGCARHRHAVCTPELATVGSQALHQPQMLQHGRMEIVRELANVACELERLLLKLHELLSQLLTDVVLAQPLLETTEGDRHTCQLLADVVVQVARDPRPLDLLRPDQPPGQRLNLLMTRLQCRLARANPIFGVLPFGDVDVAADIAGETAVRTVLRNARRQQPSVTAVSVAKAILQEEWPAALRTPACTSPGTCRRHPDGQSPASPSRVTLRAADPPTARSSR